MEEEKPLHVRVAEALGCKIERHEWHAGFVEWLCDCLSSQHAGRGYEGEHTGAIFRYDTEWEATGPLIEKYRIDLRAPAEIGCGNPSCEEWRAESVDEDVEGSGATPLLAVCNLILALKAAGKLAA